MQWENDDSDLWHLPTVRRVKEVVGDKFEAGAGARVSPLVVEVLDSADQLSAVQVGRKRELNSGGRSTVAFNAQIYRANSWKK